MSETDTTLADQIMEAKSENDENSSERGAESREQTDRAPQWKLRDLRPEKDPMGAGRETAAPTSRTEK
jgi:hypothetical protein